MTVPRMFTCQECGGEFECGWSEEEAAAERDTLWTQPEEIASGFGQVCDDCFREFMGWFKKTHPDHPAAGAA